MCIFAKYSTIEKYKSKQIMQKMNNIVTKITGCCKDNNNKKKKRIMQFVHIYEYQCTVVIITNLLF